MSKGIATMVAIVMLAHGFFGLFIEGRHFLLFNYDFALDLMYLSLGVVLFFASRERAGAPLVRAASLFVGAVLVGVGLLGLLDRYLFGAAPLGLMPLDFLFFWGLGGAALLASVLPRAHENIWEVEREETPVQS